MMDCKVLEAMQINVGLAHSASSFSVARNVNSEKLFTENLKMHCKKNIVIYQCRRNACIFGPGPKFLLGPR